MSFINWGHETPEQLRARKAMEERMMFEQMSYSAAVAAAAAAGSGRLPDPKLTSLQITTFVISGANSDNYFYKTVNYTDKLDSVEVDSGVNNGDWEVDQIFPDAMGYTVVKYYQNTTDSYILHYVGPGGNIIDVFEYSDTVYNQFKSYTYYNGGVGYLVSGETAGARFRYYYNGIKYEQVWPFEEYFGVYMGSPDLSRSSSYEGVVNLMVYTNGISTRLSHWQFGPGVSNGAAIIEEYADQSYVGYDFEQGYFMEDAKPPFLGYSPGKLFVHDSGAAHYLSILKLIKGAREYDFFNDVKEAILAEYPSANTNKLVVTEFSWKRCGLDLIVTVDDTDTGGASYTCVIDTANELVRVMMRNFDSFFALDIPDNKTLVFQYAAGSNNNGSFISSTEDFIYWILYEDNTMETYIIPKTIGGDDTYLIIWAASNINSSNEISVLGYVDDGSSLLKRFTFTKGSPETYTTSNISNIGMLSTLYIYYNQCYNDIKGEWFSILTLIDNIGPAGEITQIVLDPDLAVIGTPEVFDRTGTMSNWQYGWYYVPAVVYLEYLDNSHKVYCLNYNTYSWELKIDITTTDGYLSTGYENYYGGYQNCPGASHLLFVDPDQIRSWYITSKYGAVETNSIPVVEIAPITSQIGQTFTLSFIDGNEPLLANTQTNTGRINRINTSDWQQVYYAESQRDNSIWIVSTGEQTEIKTFAGRYSVSFPIVNIDWVYNDMYRWFTN